nr:MAG TPA: hypothetical protein [Caudoviricetes sp.]
MFSIARYTIPAFAALCRHRVQTISKPFKVLTFSTCLGVLHKG